MKKWMFMKDLGYIYLLDSNMFLYIYLTLAFGFDWTVGDILLGIEMYFDRCFVKRRARVQRLAWHPKTVLYLFSGKIKKKKEKRVTVAELKKFRSVFNVKWPKEERDPL